MHDSILASEASCSGSKGHIYGSAQSVDELFLRRRAAWTEVPTPWRTNLREPAGSVPLESHSVDVLTKCMLYWFHQRPYQLTSVSNTPGYPQPKVTSRFYSGSRHWLVHRTVALRAGVRAADIRGRVGSGSVVVFTCQREVVSVESEDKCRAHLVAAIVMDYGCGRCVVHL